MTRKVSLKMRFEDKDKHEADAEALRDAFSRCHRRWCETAMRATKQDAATSKQTTLRESSYGG